MSTRASALTIRVATSPGESSGLNRIAGRAWPMATALRSPSAKVEGPMWTALEDWSIPVLEK